MRRGALFLTLGLALATTARAQTSPTNVQPPPQPPPGPVAGSVELDHVVAIVGSNVLLESDVVLEMHLSALEPLQVLPGQNTPAAGLRRLIDRTLIMEQMKEQQQPVTVPASELQKSLADLRKSIPACHAKYPCATEQGWEDFLRANSLTPELVDERWSQRMAILRFIDLRFRSGIRVSQDQISAYYQKTLVPALEKSHETAPPLADVSPRIQEILLEQQVSGLFQDWLSSLRDQGNVRIVDEAYSADLGTSQNSNGGEQSQ
ncbi:MAG TPA: peptidylprolyl isomerase [Acidobacteriaceae bacterium]